MVNTTPSAAMIGYGSTFAIESSASPNQSPVVYTDLAEVFNIKPPNLQVAEVDVTHNTSPNRTREFIAGLTDPGETSFEMNFVPGSAADDRIQALKTAGTVVKCKITFPNGEYWTFTAFVKGYEISAGTAEKMTATVTMRVSSAPVAS